MLFKVNTRKTENRSVNSDCWPETVTNLTKIYTTPVISIEAAKFWSGQNLVVRI